VTLSRASIMMFNEIIKQTNRRSINKTDRYFHRDGKIADKVLKYCPACKIVWEKYQYKGKTNFYFYDNIPKYGKSDEKCPNCK